MTSEEELLKAIRRWIVFFILALVVSGVTAFGLETELRWLLDHWDAGPSRNRAEMLSGGSGLRGWVYAVYTALRETNANWPFLAYGYDWLAFAHLVIAVAFIGPLMDPVRNKWVILFGMIACVMVFPLAFLAGAVRGIPVYWRLIDCSFGVIGLVPLGICYRRIGMLEKMMTV